MYEGNPRKVVATDLTIRIECRNALKPAFLTGYLSYLYQSGYWRERAGGASGSMKKITRKQIKAQMVPVLHRTEQERICAELTHDIGLASNVQDVVDDECNALSALPAALLRLAFSGKL